MNIFERDNTYIAKTYARFPLAIVSGKGAIAVDDKGKEYIDLATGIAVNIFGYADSEWQNAVISQINKVQHTSNLFYSEPCGKLAELLCNKSGMKRAFLSNSGAEANECAIKVAREYAFSKYGKDKYKIITLVNSFHGRTITTLSATGQDVFHKNFLPLTEGFLYAAANDIEGLRKLFAENNIAGFMFETIQGEGGVMPLEKEFLLEAEKLCKENDAVMIADEVQCGNGRCGKLFAFMNYGIKPNVITTAKGLGGGLPIGATLLDEKTEGVLGAGMHGSTFGGNPVASAGAVSIVERLNDKLFEGVTERGNYIVNALKGKSGVKSVSGMGLMLGIETEKSASEVIDKCRENGVIVIKAKNKVRLLPPLNIDMVLLKKAVDILIDACKV